ncbi:hypothetical protein [Daejeonella sp.]|uniref:hypothetical protein n=1 Tax=Daejeonella sp. TaxID=2805397 RepID=UPI0030C1F058
MEQFGIMENGYKDAMRQGRPKRVYGALLAIFVLFGVFYNKGFKAPENSTPLLIFIAVFAVVIIIAFYLLDKRLRELFESFTLTLEDQLITREQHDTATVSILRNEVTEITKDQHGAFTIKGVSKENIIKIPAQIENSEKLEQLLHIIKPIIVKSNWIFTVRELGFLAILLTAIALVEYSVNKIFIGIGAAILAIGLTYMIIHAQQDRNLDYRTKRGMWLILIAAIPAFRMIYDKLF